jgi:regulator of sigma E protease
MMVTVLAFVLTLAVLIVVHEYGHYRVAVACGVKVLRFSVGFGRVIWRRQRDADSTEFVVCALPLGGYVRMLDEREGRVPAAELDRCFNRKPLRHRVAIVAAGPLANLGLAVLLYAASNWLGVNEPKAVMSAPAPASLAESAGLRAGDWVRAIARPDGEWQEVRSLADLRWEVTQAALREEPLRLSVTDRDGRGAREMQLDLDRVPTREVDATFMRAVGIGPGFSEAVLGRVAPAGPAAAAGLREGDRVLSVDGAPVTDAQQLREKIRAALQSPAQGQDAAALEQRWRVLRDGGEIDIAVRPRVAEEAGGRRTARIDAYVGRPPEMTKVHYGPVEGLWKGAVRTWEVSVMTLRMLGRMLVGEASIKNLSGPLTIADYAGQSVQLGLAYYLGFLAVVSVSLGVLNLLPLPMLDGGHLMYYLFEGVTGRPVSEEWLARLQRGGIAVLLAMMSVALFNDVARLLGLH